MSDPVTGVLSDPFVRNPRSNLRDPLTSAVRSTGTNLHFALNQPARVTLEILDIQGRVVDRIESGWLAAGDHERAWPQAGHSVRSGLYLARLKVGAEQSIVKLSVMGR